jgi:PEP-CTERM motif
LKTHLLVLVCLLVLPLSVAHANSYTYDVEGMLAISGHATCDGAPCVEALAFSFVWQYVPLTTNALSGVTTYQGATTHRHVTSTGPLAPFALVSSPSVAAYIPFINSARDEIDLLVSFDSYITETPLVMPAFRGLAQLWGCQSEACAQGFGPGEPRVGLPLYGPATVHVTRVPEPMTLLLVALGILGFAGARRARWI